MSAFVELLYLPGTLDIYGINRVYACLKLIYCWFLVDKKKLVHRDFCGSMSILVPTVKLNFSFTCIC